MILHPLLSYDIAKNKFSHWGTADIAVADE
jgi:hypothetical protein